jgi:hypothetical protein
MEKFKILAEEISVLKHSLINIKIQLLELDKSVDKVLETLNEAISHAEIENKGE